LLSLFCSMTSVRVAQKLQAVRDKKRHQNCACCQKGLFQQLCRNHHEERFSKQNYFAPEIHGRLELEIQAPQSLSQIEKGIGVP